MVLRTSVGMIFDIIKMFFKGLGLKKGAPVFRSPYFFAVPSLFILKHCTGCRSLQTTGQSFSLLQHLFLLPAHGAV